MAPPSSMAMLPDELLREIFSRLPHAASAIRCNAVCKTWFSVIQELNHPNHHPYHGGGDYSDRSYSRPYTLLFKFQRFLRINMGPEYKSGVYDSLEPIDDALYTPYGPTHLRNSTHYIDFIPWQLRFTHVVACGGDFLLLKPSRSHPLYVCNLQTRKCSPISGDFYLFYGLAWDCRRRDQCRVVAASIVTGDRVDEFVFWMHIFSIDTGEWRRVNLTVPRALTPLGYNTIEYYADAVACVDGILYFPTGSIEAGDKKITGILGINPFLERIARPHFVTLPAFFPVNELRTKSCFGEVRGRLRLSHSRLYDPMRVINLRIWELRNSDDGDAPVPWRMIHHVHLPLEGVGRMLVPALHPNNGDMVFVLRDNDICRYNVREDKYNKIGEIPDIQGPERLKYQLYLFLNVFTLLH